MMFNKVLFCAFIQLCFGAKLPTPHKGQRLNSINDYCTTGTSIQSKFQLPESASTVTGDSVYVYVTLGNRNYLYGYKLASDGLPLGSGYQNSVNITVTLPSSTDSSYTTSVAYGNNVYIGESPNLVHYVDTAAMITKYSVNIFQMPQFMTVDKTGLLYVSDGAEIVNVYDASKGSGQRLASFDMSSNGVQAAACGIYAAANQDVFYFSMPTVFINVYSIQRNQPNQLPINLTKSGFVNENGCVFVMSNDKWSSLLTVDGNVLAVNDQYGNVNAYCLPTYFDTLHMYADLKYGFAYFIDAGFTYNGYLYATSYPQTDQ